MCGHTFYMVNWETGSAVSSQLSLVKGQSQPWALYCDGLVARGLL